MSLSTTPMPSSPVQAIQLSAYNLGRSSTESQRLLVKAEGGRIEGRTPTHFICLLDVSGSMDADGRLRNCIDSLKYVVRFLTADDRFSLITFSDTAETKCSLVQMDAAGQASVLHTLNQIYTLGSTNLSSALERLTRILRAGSDLAGAPKQGVLLLTDGYVNIGLTDEGGLTGMVSGFMTEFPRATLTAVGYGTEHNRDLLNAMTTRAAGTYNIVRDREDVASVFGAVMGSMVSCVGLNLRVLAPRGTILREERHMEDVEESLTAIALGDVYAETTTSLCLIMPAGLPCLTHIRVQVYDVVASATYEALIEIRSPTMEIEREASVYMIRQDIAGLLRLIGSVTAADISSLLQKAQIYDGDVDRMIGDFGETTPILRVLKEEIREAIATLERIRDRPAYEASVDMTIMAQHARYLSQGGGTRATSGGVNLSQAVAEDPFMSPMTRHVSGGAAATMSARAYHETDDPAFHASNLPPVPLLQTPPRHVAGGLAVPPLLPQRPPFGGLRRAMTASVTPPSPIPEINEEAVAVSSFLPTVHSSMSEVFLNMMNNVPSGETAMPAPTAFSSRQVAGTGLVFGFGAYQLPRSLSFSSNNIPNNQVAHT